MFEHPDGGRDNIFAYVGMNEFPEGASDPWHCDGGPSIIFMAVSVQDLVQKKIEFICACFLSF